MGNFNVAITAIIAVLAVLLVRNGQDLSSWSVERHDNITISAPSWNVLHHLGGYGPYLQKTFNITTDVVEDIEYCKIDQVHMVSRGSTIARHTERYPTVTAGLHMLNLYYKIDALESTLNGSLAFAQYWSFLTGWPSKDFEQLTSTGPYAGTLTAFKMGVEARSRYKDLLQQALDRSPLRLWASDSQRVIDTARLFSAGLVGLDWQTNLNLQIIPETADQGANTLTPGDTCLNYAEDQDDYGWNYGSRMVDKFKSTYLKHTQERLAAENPRLLLSDDELYVMQELCGFEIMAKGKSQWCDVFTYEEWLAFAYTRDLLHYYRSGPGNPYAATMGWLWLNATASLLKQGPDAGSLFVSFVHDGDIIPMLAALDLFPQPTPLPTTHIEHNRTWRISDTVPMGARIVFERLSCQTDECWANELYPNHVYCQRGEDTQHIRILVNDKQVLLPGCTSGPSSTCEVEAFLEHIARRGKDTGTFAEVCGLSEDAPKSITFLHQ